MSEEFRISSRSDSRINTAGKSVLPNAGQSQSTSSAKDLDVTTIEISSGKKQMSSSAKVSLEVSNSVSSLTVLSQALTEIRTLLKSKAQIQEAQSTGSKSAQTKVIDDQIAKLDEKISAIIVNTSFNDQDLFSGFQTSTVIIPPLPAFSGDAKQDQTNVDSLSASVDQGLSSLEANIGSIAKSRLENTQPVLESNAPSLAQKISGEISSPFNSATNNRLVIEASSAGLTPERVSFLLQ